MSGLTDEFLVLSRHGRVKIGTFSKRKMILMKIEIVYKFWLFCMQTVWRFAQKGWLVYGIPFAKFSATANEY